MELYPTNRTINFASGMLAIKSFLIILFLLCNSPVWSAVGDKYSCDLIKRPWIEENSVTNKAPDDWPTKVLLLIDWKKDNVVVLKRTFADRKNDGTLGAPHPDRWLPEGGLELTVEGIWKDRIPEGENKFHNGFWGTDFSWFSKHHIRFTEANLLGDSPSRLLWIESSMSPLTYNVQVWDFICVKY